jgi:hypothetical protein
MKPDPGLHTQKYARLHMPTIRVPAIQTTTTSGWITSAVKSSKGIRQNFQADLDKMKRKS